MKVQIFDFTEELGVTKWFIILSQHSQPNSDLTVMFLTTLNCAGMYQLSE